MKALLKKDFAFFQVFRQKSGKKRSQIVEELLKIPTLLSEKLHNSIIKSVDKTTVENHLRFLEIVYYRLFLEKPIKRV